MLRGVRLLPGSDLPSRPPTRYRCRCRPPQEKVIKDVLLVDQPIKRFVKPEEVRGAGWLAGWLA